MQAPGVHLCIIQPAGDVSPLGFLDQARFFRWQFRRLGAEVSIGKNRLRHDAVNFILGAHLGFDAALRERHTCVFVNLEQLGAGGKPVARGYLELLASSAAVDYEQSNVAAYARPEREVPIISFGHAPYLAGAGPMPLEQRPIDILFFGAVNERRRRLIAAIEAAGRTVASPRGLIYGPERDGLIAQAKVVFNCHFYETARFEQARVFHCLSMGTPVVSERAAATAPPLQFEDSVFWAPTETVGAFFAQRFGAAGFADECRAKLAAFAQHEVLAPYAQALDLARRVHAARVARVGRAPWQPKRLHLGAGQHYLPGWFNVDPSPAGQADATLDLARPLILPLRLDSTTAGPVLLQAGGLDFVFANQALEDLADPSPLLTNCLALLRTGGELSIESRGSLAGAAWRDAPSGLGEADFWRGFADRFWALGWFSHRFELQQIVFLDERGQPCDQDVGHTLRVRLLKVETTLVERTRARAMRPDFGGIPDDAAPEQPARAALPRQAGAAQAAPVASHPLASMLI